jgi:glycosyltransferase involved in cell wall biosynthesis
MPYFGCPETVTRAVASVLDQTHRDLTLVVVGDGVDVPDLGDLRRDSRLVVWRLPDNRGRYFCDAVTLAASDTDWWTPHDADDWSDPDRLERLLDAADGADAVFGGYRQHQLSGAVVDRAPSFDRLEAGRLRHVAHHTALYRPNRLRSIYGPHPGWRFGWDTLQVALAWSNLSTAQVDTPLYHHCQRPGSLAMAPATGMRSAARRVAHRNRDRLWQRCLDDPAHTRDIVAATVCEDDAVAVRAEADHLGTFFETTL